MLQLSTIMVSVQAALVNGLFALLLISLLCKYVRREGREAGREGREGGRESESVIATSYKLVTS